VIIVVRRLNKMRSLSKKHTTTSPTLVISITGLVILILRKAPQQRSV